MATAAIYSSCQGRRTGGEDEQKLCQRKAGVEPVTAQKLQCGLAVRLVNQIAVQALKTKKPVAACRNPCVQATLSGKH